MRQQAQQAARDKMKRKRAPPKPKVVRRGPANPLAEFLIGQKTANDKEIEAILKNRKKLLDLWKNLDFNGNGVCSLAEVGAEQPRI